MSKKKISKESPIVYYRGLFRQFKVISAVELTKVEVDNIIFFIKDEKEVCDKNVISKNIVESLKETNDKVESCYLSTESSRWIIKINIDWFLVLLKTEVYISRFPLV